jgi:hypothetical protein
MLIVSYLIALGLIIYIIMEHSRISKMSNDSSIVEYKWHGTYEPIQTILDESRIRREECRLRMEEARIIPRTSLDSSDILRRDMMGGPTPGGLRHFGQVKKARERFKEYSKEDFRDISNEPVIKDILTGSCKISFDEKLERINEYLKD